MQMRAAQLDNGKWVVEFLDDNGIWGSTIGQTEHPDKISAEKEMEGYQLQNALANEANWMYQRQLDYACGYRE